MRRRLAVRDRPRATRRAARKGSALAACPEPSGSHVSPRAPGRGGNMGPRPAASNRPCPAATVAAKVHVPLILTIYDVVAAVARLLASGWALRPSRRAGRAREWEERLVRAVPAIPP